MQCIRSDSAAKTAGEQLTTQLNHYREQPILLMLSGGSAWSLLEYVSPDVLGPHITITTLDERFSTDVTINNFAQLSTTQFYAQARAKGVAEISTLIEAGDTLVGAGQRFETALRAWRIKYPDGVVLATVGVGPDGHTAGIFPGAYEIEFSDTDWVVAYVVPKSINQYPERITVTYTFLRTQLTEAVLFISGSEKKHLIDSLLSSTCELQTMPACILTELAMVTLVTDILE